MKQGILVAAVWLLSLLGCTAPGETLGFDDLDRWRPPWEERGERSGPHCTIFHDRDSLAGIWRYRWRVYASSSTKVWWRGTTSLRVRFEVDEDMVWALDDADAPVAGWRIAQRAPLVPNADAVCGWHDDHGNDPESWTDDRALRVDWTSSVLPPPEPSAEPTFYFGDDSDDWLPSIEPDRVRVVTGYATGTIDLAVEHVFER